MGAKRNLYRILVGKRPLRRRRWKDNIRMDLREIDGVVWTGLISLMMGTGGGFL
jgi:hypothetical protein